MRQLLVGIVAQTSCLQARMPALPHPSLTHYELLTLGAKVSLPAAVKVAITARHGCLHAGYLFGGLLNYYARCGLVCNSPQIVIL
jgi:hypothetical protein